MRRARGREREREPSSILSGTQNERPEAKSFLRSLWQDADAAFRPFPPSLSLSPPLRDEFSRADALMMTTRAVESR